MLLLDSIPCWLSSCLTPLSPIHPPPQRRQTLARPQYLRRMTGAPYITDLANHAEGHYEAYGCASKVLSRSRGEARETVGQVFV
jgi:hypothetical protein